MAVLREVKMMPIGYVRRASKVEDVKDRSLISKIIVRKDLIKALDGLEDFSHVFVIFFMHEITKNKRQHLKVHPRGREDLPLVGVLATRSAFRPNPIGLTLVELLKREGNVLTVRGLDAFDRTPVLDLKGADDRDMATRTNVPKWLSKLHSKP